MEDFKNKVAELAEILLQMKRAAAGRSEATTKHGKQKWKKKRQSCVSAWRI